MTHEKKLLNLWKKQSNKCPDCIVNLSKKSLNLHEQNALRFGLKHPILLKKVQKDKIKTNVEKLVYTLKRNTDVEMNDEIQDDIKFLVKRFVNDANRACSESVNQFLHHTLHKLSMDASIKVCKFDKGNGIAILESDDYYRKLDKIVDDKSKFLEITKDIEHMYFKKRNQLSTT